MLSRSACGDGAGGKRERSSSRSVFRAPRTPRGRGTSAPSLGLTSKCPTAYWYCVVLRARFWMDPPRSNLGTSQEIVCIPSSCAHAQYPQGADLSLSLFEVGGSLLVVVLTSQDLPPLGELTGTDSEFDPSELLGTDHPIDFDAYALRHRTPLLNPLQSQDCRGHLVK